MQDFILVIGNKNYSSWSLRPWLALRHTGASFREVVIPLHQPDSHERIVQYSPSGQVPVLHHGPIVVWDSLAICEYLAELFPESALWPSDRAARAEARSICAEMHSGFAALRTGMKMDVRSERPGLGRTPESLADIERICAIWRGALAGAKGGPFLFGSFSIADAMFAPIVFRFRTYGVDLDSPLRAYCSALLGLPAIREWEAEARAEVWAR